MKSKKNLVQFSRSEKIILAICAIVNFSHIVDFMILMPLGPQLMRLFAIGPEKFGLLVSSYNFSAGIMGLLASIFLDRFDRKKALIFFFSGFTIGTFFCGISTNYEMLLSARILTGMFGGVLNSIIYSIVSDSIEFSRRGSAMGIVMGAFSVASVFGVPFSLFLANQFDWSAPFIFLAGVAVLVMPLIFTFVPSMNLHLKDKKQDQHMLSNIFEVLSNKQYTYSLLFISSLVLGQFSIIPFISPSFVANTGMTEAQLPLTYLIGGLASMVSSPLAGQLADLHGKKRVFHISLLISTIPVFIITNLGPTPVLVTLFISTSFFIVMSGRMVPGMAIISSVPLPRHRGAFMSMVSSVQQFTAALAAYITGHIVTTNESGRLINYQYAGYIAIAFSLFAIWLSKDVEAGEKT